jgi:hypothetical protein
VIYLQRGLLYCNQAILDSARFAADLLLAAGVRRSETITEANAHTSDPDAETADRAMCLNCGATKHNCDEEIGVCRVRCLRWRPLVSPRRTRRLSVAYIYGFVHNSFGGAFMNRDQPAVA